MDLTPLDQAWQDSRCRVQPATFRGYRHCFICRQDIDPDERTISGLAHERCFWTEYVIDLGPDWLAEVLKCFRARGAQTQGRE